MASTKAALARGSARRRVAWALAWVLAAGAAAAAVSLPASTAWADSVDPSTRAAARKLGGEAMALYDQGDYQAALEKFTLANKLVPAPTLAVRIARCLVRLGRLVEASEKYLEVTRTELERNAPAVHRKAVAEALAERDKIQAMIPSLVIALQGPRGDSLSIAVDGVSVPVALLGERRPIDPGTHRVEVRRGDEPPIVRQVTLDTGEASRLDVALPPLPVQPAPLAAAGADKGEPFRKAVGRVGLAIGAAGLVVGVSHGIAAIVEQGALLDRCGAARVCPADAAGAARFYDVTRVASTIGFVAAGAGLALSVPFFLPDRAPSADGARTGVRVTPWIGAGAGVRGDF